MSELSLSLSSLSAKCGGPTPAPCPHHKKKTLPRKCNVYGSMQIADQCARAWANRPSMALGCSLRWHSSPQQPLPQRPMPPSSSPLSTSSHAGAMAKGRGAVRGCRLGGNWQREERKGASMLYREPQCCCASVGIGTLMVEVEGKLWLTEYG